jgi:hypothetical protein
VTHLRTLPLILGLLALTLVACQPRDGDIEDTYTLGPTAVVIGDSLTKGGRDYLHAALDDDFASKLAGIAGSTYGKMFPYAEAYAPDRPTVAVLALGTNDRQPTWDLAESIETMNRMYDLFPDSCTIGISVTTHNTREDLNVKARALNEAVQLRADVLVDWDSVAAEPGMTQEDEVHPTPEGHVVRARMIADAARDCGVEEPPPPTTTTTTTLVPDTLPETP